MPDDVYGAYDRLREKLHAEPDDSLLPVQWFNDIEPVLDTRDFVKGLLTTGGASVIYGESNAGKTFFATDLALSIAAGLEWMGLRVEAGAVAYCVLEGGNGFRNRVHVWRQARGMVDVPVPFMSIPASINLLDAGADVARLIATLKAASDHIGQPFKLIVIDTLSRAMAGGNENAPEDMGALVRNMDHIREETGAAFLFIHHSGKDASKGARGHSLLRAAIDTEIEVAVDEDGGRTARVVKQRELAKGAAYPFRLDVVEIGQNAYGEPVTSCTVEPPDENAPAGAPRRPKLSGDTRHAFEILHDALASAGAMDHAGVPSGFASVPEDWWRERFYERAKPGASSEVKRQAFRRAADKLVQVRAVAVNVGRVWALW